ncbi:MAG: bifunctional phosphoglucose/phosphomannose isomerase [Anaerolineaceae bacterium]
MNALDDDSLLALDGDGMLVHIANVGTELARAWKASEDLQLPESARDATNVVLAGMGGSATAGDYFATLCAESAELPVCVSRGFSLPNFVSERSLVVVTSHSGDTDEALSLYDDAWKRGAALLCITSGGKLGARAAEDGVPVHQIRYSGKPRTAIAHGLAPLLRVGAKLGLLSIDDTDLVRAADAHAATVAVHLGSSLQFERNPGKQVAAKLSGRTPFVVGSGQMAPVATRFRNQLAENAKILGAADSFPEAAHNLIVGLGTAGTLSERFAVVVIESRERADQRTVAKLDAFCGQFEAVGIPLARIDVGGGRLLQQLLVGTAWGDYVSFYLALLNGVDPTPIPQIDQIKLALGETGTRVG